MRVPLEISPFSRMQFYVLKWQFLGKNLLHKNTISKRGPSQIKQTQNMNSSGNLMSETIEFIVHAGPWKTWASPLELWHCDPILFSYFCWHKRLCFSFPRFCCLHFRLLLGQSFVLGEFNGIPFFSSPEIKETLIIFRISHNVNCFKM